MSNCFKYMFQLVGWVVKLHRSLIGRQNVRQCFSLATYGVYKLLYTQPNSFKYIHTSCIHPCKANYPCVWCFTSTLSNLPRYLKLLRNYADKDEEVDLKLQRKSLLPLRIVKEHINKLRESGLFRLVVMSYPLLKPNL